MNALIALQEESLPGTKHVSYTQFSNEESAREGFPETQAPKGPVVDLMSPQCESDSAVALFSSVQIEIGSSWTVVRHLNR